MTVDTPRILITGGGARSTAIAMFLRRSKCSPVLMSFGESLNPQLRDLCDDYHEVSDDLSSEFQHVLARFRPSLGVVGPAEHLSYGLVDQMREAGIVTIGPSASLARIENSKCWSAEIIECSAPQVHPQTLATSDSRTVETFVTGNVGVAVKPDGLTGGKGVRVFDQSDAIDAVVYATSLIRKDGRAVIQERLHGDEFCVQSFTDSRGFFHGPAVRDYKLSEEGGLGINTGGMGAYSCGDNSLPGVPRRVVLDAQTILEDVVRYMVQREGEPYVGIIHGNFIATESGLRLLECNARLGDSDGINVLAAIDGDLCELLMATSERSITGLPLRLTSHATVTKYLVPNNYPNPTEPSFVRVDYEALERSGGSLILGGVVGDQSGNLLTTNSRAAVCLGVAPELRTALALADAAAGSVSGDLRSRSDIACDAIHDSSVDED
ncbi:MAG: hypothetical protein GY788_05445 [bacterium]|nr:hypothetical protein [bacterium]